MNIDVIFSAGEVNSSRIAGRTAVVIDVLRATTVMVTALHNGASGIWPVLSPEDGFRLKEQNKKEEVILGGERHTELIPGFDFGNSPLDYTSERVAGKKIGLTTTNGTRALQASMGAKELYIAAFTNASATASHIIHNEHITLVCSGSNNVFTIEDALCAGYICHLLTENKNETTLSDSALAVKQLYNSNPDNCRETASAGRHYNLLKAKGLHSDLNFCFQKDILSTICRWKGTQKGIVIV